MAAAPIVTVRGEAQLEGPPDLAAFTFTAHRVGDAQDGVRSALATASVQVRDLLRPYESSLERSSTSGLHVAPIFSGRAQSKVQGYRGSFSTEVVVRDLDVLSTIVLGLAPVADSQLDGPYWSLRPDNPLYREVRLAAIADARRRADDYAAAFGGTVVGLLEISDLDTGLTGGSAAPMRFALASGPSEQPDFEFEPAVQTVSGQVSVRFTITAPDVSRS